MPNIYRLQDYLVVHVSDQYAAYTQNEFQNVTQCNVIPLLFIVKKEPFIADVVWKYPPCPERVINNCLRK